MIRPRVVFQKRTSLEDPDSFHTAINIPEQGKDAQCVGYCPRVASEPLKCVNPFTWHTYDDIAAIDERGRFQTIDHIKVSLNTMRIELILNSAFRRSP